MKAQTFKSNPFKETKVYLIPITGQYNTHSFKGGVSSMNDDEEIELIVKKYIQRFEGAWEELSEK